MQRHGDGIHAMQALNAKINENYSMPAIIPLTPTCPTYDNSRGWAEKPELPKSHLTAQDRLAYLEKRDKVLTDLEKWFEQQKTELRADMKKVAGKNSQAYRFLYTHIVQIEETEMKIKELEQ